VYKLSDQTSDANVLFEYLKGVLTGHLRDTALTKLRALEGNALLKEFMRQWNNYLMLSKWMSKMFNYLDRYYLKFSNMDSTVLTAIKLFKSVVFDTLKQELVDAVLEEIRKWREGDDVDWAVLHLVIESFITIGITKNAKIEKGTSGEGSFKWGGEQNLHEYDGLFEKTFLQHTKEYYKQQADQWFVQLNSPEYIRKALSRFEEEEKKAVEHMQQKTKGALI
jgi:AraC-like DNA-binding protein